MLELRGAAPGLLDEPLLLDVGGAAPSSTLVWRGRIRDDDGFVWRAEGASPDVWRWTAKADGVASLRSLRPVELEVRVEGADGAATRALTRTVLDASVKARRWREGVTGRLFLPTDPVATLVADGEEPHTLVAAALIASRGVRVFVATGGSAASFPIEDARRLGALPVPPGLPALEPADAAVWDALLAELGATPRRVAR